MSITPGTHLARPTEIINQPVWLQSLLISLIVAALMAGPIEVLKIIDPDGPWQMLPLVAFLLALEATTITWWLHRTTKRFSKPVFRAAELFLLIVFMRLVAWTLDGQPPFTSSIRDYLINPFLIINRTYLVLIFLTFLTWWRAAMFSNIFKQLEITNFEKHYYADRHGPTTWSLHETLPPIDRQALLHYYVREWMFGGLILAFIATLTTFDLSVVSVAVSETISLRNIGRLGLPPEILFALLIYFIGGLWLASIGRLKVVESRWLAGDFEVDPSLLLGWRRLSALLLVLVALVAAFLPIGSTFAISHLFQLLISSLFFILNLIVAVLSYVFYLLISVFGISEPEPPPEQHGLLSELPQFEPIPGPASDTPALVAGSLFWLVAISVTILAIIFFMKARGLTLKTGVLSSLWSMITGFIAIVWRMLWNQVENATASVGSRLRRTSLKQNVQLPGLILPSLGQLPPRLQIRLIYISLVRKAGREGVRRRNSVTPLEYDTELKAVWPEASEDLDTLTRAFLMARYSHEKIDKSRLAPVKSAWSNLKSLIRAQK